MVQEFKGWKLWQCEILRFNEEFTLWLGMKETEIEQTPEHNHVTLIFVNLVV